MPPRPKGTDGSDYTHREIIAERYQRMADYKHSITRLMASHVVLTVVKCGWTSLGRLQGDPIPLYMQAMLGLEVVVTTVFVAAKMGQRTESLALLKAFNLLQALVASAHVLSAWRYYNGLNMVERQYSKIAEGLILSKTSAFAPGTVSQVVAAAELTLDLTLGAFLLMATLISHRMIKEKMEAKSEAANRGAAKKAADDDGDEAPQAVPLEDDGDGSPEKRVTAKASMRRRARMA